ncbi:MAG: EAL domain-containing protein [Eubacteriales bacterium]|nr:EAL domain-containing protein [Eubacteriales bacterium]
MLLIALIWMRQSMIGSNDRMMEAVRQYYEQAQNTGGAADAEFVALQIEQMKAANTRTMLMGAGLFVFAIVIMLTNHFYMNKRSVENERMANIDPMTGVKSKHAYLVREKEIDEAIEEGSLETLAVVVCDVNGLKKINDTLGHKAGDEYICAACKMVCEIFAHSPVYRIGGDEFVMILTGRDYILRKDLLKLLHDRSVANISAGGVVVSGGVSEYVPGQDRKFHDIFERADELMYEEKQLLKGLGSISRDEDPEEVVGTPEIFSVRKQVLIVEDEEVNQLLLGNALREDYEVLFASDGVEAMEAAHTNKKDLSLVLLDLQMPRMGGMEVLRTMKADEDLKHIPIIVLTADQRAEVECLKIGAMDFIPKPYPDWEIIRARVGKCIELSENRDTIQSTERESLTRLYNFDYFVRYVNMYDRHYQDMAMDAVVVDVNHFHMINERYGRPYGDKVLRHIGERIRIFAREIGGVGCHRVADTFYLYCPHRKDYTPLLESLTEGLTEDKDMSSDRIRLRIGIYAGVDKEIEIARRFDRAKVAADNVRSGHVQAIGIYDEKLHKEEIFKERLLEDFRTSIENERFLVYFQPKYDIRPEKPILASAEALVRWDHPELGLISPAVFIPLLEESGRILELDTYVWKKTAAQIRDWKERFGFSVPVSVNVSRIDMLMPNLKNIFSEILKTNGLREEDIVLEITESAYTGDSEQVISTARELRGMGMGFRIEMDDFGTGYSSLGMLTHLPIDALKLDITFIRNAFGENRDVRMIELIIDIADYLHVPVVAEGVETEEQLLVLKAMGCDLVQGYYFSKPVPPEEFDRFLEERVGQTIEVTKEVKKTYMSISRALTYDFRSIFYVDTLTDYYLEFYAGSGGELQIRPGGADFFADAHVKFLQEVCEEDRARVEEAVRKENLVKWLGKEETVALNYHILRDGKPVEYCLQTIRTRNSDDHHVVIGIRPVL